MKRVIFNADDFGASERTNVAILRAHTEGVLTATSLMVNEPAAGEAIRLAREHPTLAVGLHVVVSNGYAALPPAEVSRIAPARTPQGARFPEDPALAGMRHFFLPGARQQLAREIAAQFTRFAATGLPFSHVDGHQHLHLHPSVWDVVVRECERHDVRRIRIPYEEFRPASRSGLAARRIEWLFFRALRRRCLRTLAGRGYTLAERVYGHLETGRMTAGYVSDLLGRLGGQTNEIYLHPGAITGRTDGTNRQGSRVDEELEALLSPVVRERLTALALHLTTYAELESLPRESLSITH